MSENRNLKALQDEIKQLELEVLDMFAVCFHFAGLNEQHLEDAIALYHSKIDENSQDEYDSKNIIALIEEIKSENQHWFKD